MNITGKCRVYSYDVVGKYAKCSFKVGRRNKDGTWDNMWFNGRFVKNFPADIPKGTEIEITSAILDSYKSDKGNYIVTIIVFEYSAADALEKPGTQMEIASEDELPF
jgi:hypothetical protein